MDHCKVLDRLYTLEFFTFCKTVKKGHTSIPQWTNSRKENFILGRSVTLLLLSLLCIVSLCACGGSEQKALDLYNEALDLIKEDKLNEAFKLLNQVLSEYPETPAASEAAKKLNEQREDLQMIIHSFQIAFDAFRGDVGRYPTNNEGFDALLKNPGSDFWDGPYLPESLMPYINLLEYTVHRSGRPFLRANID